MSKRASGSQLLAFVIRFLDHAIEPRDGVLDYGGQIFGKNAVRTWLQLQVALVDQQDSGTAVSCISSVQLAENPVDLISFRKRHRHVEVQPDDVAIQLRSCQERAQLVHVATPDVEPPPEPYALGFDPRPHPVTEQCHESNAAGTWFVEVGGLGSTRIDGRYRRVPGNVPE